MGGSMPPNPFDLKSVRSNSRCSAIPDKKVEEQSLIQPYIAEQGHSLYK